MYRPTRLLESGYEFTYSELEPCFRNCPWQSKTFDQLPRVKRIWLVLVSKPFFTIMSPLLNLSSQECNPPGGSGKSESWNLFILSTSFRG